MHRHRTFLICLLFWLSFFTGLHASSEFRQTLTLEEVDIGNLLTWSTVQSGTTILFRIEKSIDGKSYISIGEVEARSSEGQSIDYSFLDLRLGDPDAYYRLVCVSRSGASLVTPAVYSSRRTGNLLRVSGMTSTVTQSSFRVHVESVQSLPLLVLLKDLDGIEIMRYPTHVQVGENVITLDMATVPEGYYRFELEVATERESLILQKVNPEKVLADGYGIQD